MMASAAKLAWYSVGSTSPSNLDLNSSSSASLLHSIYGSQVSQLPFSDYGSENSFLGDANLLSNKSGSLTNLQKKRCNVRPKSSPVSAMAAREQQRKQLQIGLTVQQRPLDQTRPVSAIPQQNKGVSTRTTIRPASAAFSSRQRQYQRRPPLTASQGAGGAGCTNRGFQSGMSTRTRPASAAPTSSSQRRPTSASRSAGQRRAVLSRPKTALGIHGMASVVQNLEDDDEDDRLQTPIIRDTPPVFLTRTPEYFNFWLGKPLLERDFSIKVHKRRAWKRPQSDYGNRLGGRSRRGSSDDGDGGGYGSGENLGLETVMEQDDIGLGDAADGDKSTSQGRGGGYGDTDGEVGDTGDGCNVNDGGDSSGTTTGDSGGHNDDNDGGSRGDGKARKKPPNTSNKKSTSRSLNDMWATKRKITWNAHDGTTEADEDDYFTHDAMAAISWLGDSKSSSPNTRFELPMDLSTLTGMTPLQYLRNHCVISNHRMTHCSEVFTKYDLDRDLKLNKEELQAALIKAHHSCITLDQVLSVLDLVQFPSDFKVELKLFAALCCFTERVLNLHYLPLSGKDLIETVDFEGLDWKLRDCTISQSLHTVFVLL